MENISEDEVYQLRELCTKWKHIAQYCNVSKSTLYRWRVSSGFEDPLGDVADEYLDIVMQQFTSENWRRGERMAVGHIRNLGVRVSRERVRLSMGRVDPAGREQRKLVRIGRRNYVSEGPLHVYHIDGNHKLIKYKLVVLAGIDGFSRAIVYAGCVPNNRATTHLNLFKEGVERYGLPSRVRGDRGGENVLIAEHMIQQRGLNRGSYIPGSSKYNTRMERGWRDIRTQVLQPYKELFEQLVDSGYLDVENDVHIFVLHYMFLDRINASLQSFVGAWNNHSVRTAGNMTPHQLLRLHQDYFPPPPEVVEDEEGNDNGSDDEAEGVPVEPVECPLDEVQFQILQQHAPPLTLNDAFETLAVKFLYALFVVNFLLQ